jgi:hypothetical protein
MGTLAGQTRIRPVPSDGRSNGVLGIIEEAWTLETDNGARRRSSYQLNHVGVGESGDVIVLSPLF